MDGAPLSENWSKAPAGNYLWALGHMRSREEIYQDLFLAPRWSEASRRLKPLDRQRGIASLSEVFLPLPEHRRLAEDIQIILRTGYANRKHNPKTVKRYSLNENSHKTNYKYEAIDQELRADNSRLSATLIGIPGMGKTSAIRRALSAYPQCVEHDGLSPQVTWLEMSCPVVPTVKGFCLAFFEAIGRAIGNPDVTGVFGHQAVWADGLPESVRRLAENHAVGLLVVDDIQHLSSVKNGEDQKILQALESLSGRVGVPVLLVGTNAAAETICYSRTALRSVGYASEVWGRIEKGPVWDDFLARLWRYQWTRTETALTDELSETFYDRCQGVASLAVRLYQRVQSMLIRQAEILKDKPAEGALADMQSEIITPGFVEVVSNHLFSPVQGLLDALRSQDPAKLHAFDDLAPLPSQAKRMQEALSAEKDQQQQEEQKPSVTVDASGGDEEDTDVSVEERIRLAEQATDLMLGMARKILEEEDYEDDTIRKELAGIVDVLGGRIHQQKRKFFKELENRVKKRGVTFRQADDPMDDKSFNAQVFDPADLRGMLKEPLDPLGLLRKRKVDGQTGLRMDP